MVALSAAMAVPMRYAADVLTWSQRALQGAAGAVTMALGCWLLAQSALA